MTVPRYTNLTPTEMAEQLGISEHEARATLADLISFGWVRVLPGPDGRDLYELRFSLEELTEAERQAGLA